MALHPNGVNHLAISTKAARKQLSFSLKCSDAQPKRSTGAWSQGCYHGFAELSESSYVAFVQHPTMLRKFNGELLMLVTGENR